MEMKGMGRSRAMRHQDGAFSGSFGQTKRALKQASVHKKWKDVMDTSASGSLMELLQERGIHQAVGWAILVTVPVVIAVAKGIHSLVSGWHTRRKEFAEMYEKLWIDNPDPLAIETAVRHGFGEWLPAKAIQRIRAHPFPSQRFLALKGLTRFLDINELDGAIAIKKKIANKEERMLRVIAHLAWYFISGMVVGFAILAPDTKYATPSLRVLVGILFLGSGLYSINTAVDLQRLSGVVDRYPDLFGLTPTKVSGQDARNPSSFRKRAKETASRFMSWIGRRLFNRQRPTDQSVVPVAKNRSNRSASDASTPRA